MIMVGPLQGVQVVPTQAVLATREGPPPGRRLSVSACRPDRGLRRHVPYPRYCARLSTRLQYRRHCGRFSRRGPHRVADARAGGARRLRRAHGFSSASRSSYAQNSDGEVPKLTAYGHSARQGGAQGREGQDQEDRPPAGLNPAIACYHAASQHQAASSPKQLSSREAKTTSHETSFTTRLDPEPRAAGPVALAVAARPPPVANGDRQEHAPAGQRDRQRRRPDHERDPADHHRQPGG